MTSALNIIARQAAPFSPQGEASEALVASGLPTRRAEAWKYSDLRAALADEALVAGVDLAHGHFKALAEDVDRFQRKGSVTGQLAAAMSNGLEADWLNGRASRGPGGSVAHIAVREKLVIVEDFNARERLAAHALVAHVAPGAELTRVVVQRGDGVVLSDAHVTVEAGGTFRQFVLAQGGKLARIETHVSVDGEGASIELNGAYLAGADKHADLTSVITHSAPGAETRQLIKGVAAKGGRGVFQGKIVVERAAQQTDARQYHHGMLLEAGAEIFAKPELLIHADDVQCAHGNTAGGLDEAAKFYLRSRGVPEKEARAMLIEAFLVGAIPEGLPEAIDAELRERIGKWLEAHA